MPEFSGLLLVVAVAFAAPLVLGLAPALRLPSVVLELIAGIVIGPAGFGWVELDEPIEVLSLVGLAFLLFLAGLEIEFERLRGPKLRLAALSFVASFGIAVAVGFFLEAIGQADTPLLVAIILVATSLGVVVPVLKDSGNITSDLGQLVIAAASIADFGAVILLSLLFSRESTSTAAKLILLGGFALVSLAAVVALMRIEHLRAISRVLLRLQDTTAQIRVRGAFLLLIAFVALAESLGLEVILGAFMAGAILTFVDRDQAMTHPQLRVKLEAVGFGVFIPVFFIASGIQFDLDARTIGPRHTAVAAVLQATSLPFIVAASMIGIELGLIDDATGAALIAAGLLSVLIFPLAALTILRRAEPVPRGRRPSDPRKVLASNSLLLALVLERCGRGPVRRRNAG